MTTKASREASESKARRIHVGLSLMASDDFQRASEPIFESDAIDAVEWNIDTELGSHGPSSWVESILDEYGRRGRLYAHGVELSPLSAILLPHQREWIDEMKRAFERRRYVHLSDHFGFMTSGGFVRGTPLPLPHSKALLAIAKERIRDLRAIAQCPIGLENLAIAFGADDIVTQPAFLGAALEAEDSFLLLDLHNVYCQAQNFGREPEDLCDAYPLDKVREIHIAGGSFSKPLSDPLGRTFRRDTHDGDTPEDVLALLAYVIPRCPKLEVVILERTDRSIFGSDEVARFRDEVGRIRAVVDTASRAEHKLPITSEQAQPWIQDDPKMLDALQIAILETFESVDDPHRAIESLKANRASAPYSDWIRSWEPRAVEVGISLVRQWGTRAPASQTMLAAVLPATNRTFELRHVPSPEPGPGQVVIRIHASGLCGTDVHIREGRMNMPLPAILGHEPVGIVESIGSSVTTVRIGDRVGVPWVQSGCGSCSACSRSKPQYCADPLTWVQTGGGHAERMLVDARGCVAIPEGLAFEEAAPMLCAGFTVMSGYRRASPRPSDRVAVLGVGGLGHLAVQIAKAFGHEVIALTSSQAKRSEALALGADEAIIVGEEAGKALSDAGGADIVLATSSSALHVSQAIVGLRPEGRLVLMGLGEGLLAIDPMSLILTQSSIVGATQDDREHLAQVLDLCASGRIKPRIETYPLVLVERAMNRLAERRVRYRAVLTL